MKKSVQFNDIKTTQILTKQQTKTLKGGGDSADIIIEDTQAI